MRVRVRARVAESHILGFRGIISFVSEHDDIRVVSQHRRVTIFRQVLLPVEPDARVPDWILDRTPTEVKAAYAAAVRKREQGQV